MPLHPKFLPPCGWPVARDLAWCKSHETEKKKRECQNTFGVTTRQPMGGGIKTEKDISRSIDTPASWAQPFGVQSVFKRSCKRLDRSLHMLSRSISPPTCNMRTREPAIQPQIKTHTASGDTIPFIASSIPWLDGHGLAVTLRSTTPILLASPARFLHHGCVLTCI